MIAGRCSRPLSATRRPSTHCGRRCQDSILKHHPYSLHDPSLQDLPLHDLHQRNPRQRNLRQHNLCQRKARNHPHPTTRSILCKCAPRPAVSSGTREITSMCAVLRVVVDVEELAVAGYLVAGRRVARVTSRTPQVLAVEESLLHVCRELHQILVAAQPRVRTHQ